MWPSHVILMGDPNCKGSLKVLENVHKSCWKVMENHVSVLYAPCLPKFALMLYYKVFVVC